MIIFIIHSVVNFCLFSVFCFVFLTFILFPLVLFFGVFLLFYDIFLFLLWFLIIKNIEKNIVLIKSACLPLLFLSFFSFSETVSVKVQSLWPPCPNSPSWCLRWSLQLLPKKVSKHVLFFLVYSLTAKKNPNNEKMFLFFFSVPTYLRTSKKPYFFSLLGIKKNRISVLMYF